MTVVPDLAVLLREDPEPMLVAALGASGAALESWTIDAVHARPGAETSVAYDVVASGERVYLIASTADIDDAVRARVGAVRLENEQGAVTVWRHPADPELTGLADACVPEALAARIAAADGEPCEVTGLEMMVLRPMRRAVLRARVTRDGVESAVFVKVVRPRRAARLLERHAMCALAPRARDLCDGIVLIDAAEGIPLTSHLYLPTAPEGRAPLDPALILDVLDSLPEAATALDRRPSPTEELSRYADAAIAAGLEESRVRAVAARIAAATREAPGPVVATHGDFHAANVFVSATRDPRPTALIDVDTLGPGYRADDLACLLAHLLTLEDFDGEGYADVPAWIDAVRAALADAVPAEQLAARIAAVLVSLASGIADRSLAQRWLERAESEVASLPPA